MASERERVDADVAESLTSAVKGALDQQRPQPSDTDVDPAKEVVPDPASSEFNQNVAQLVLDKSIKAADSSKPWVENVVHEIQDYAQNVVSSGAAGSTSSNVQESLATVEDIGTAHPGSATGTHRDSAASPGTNGGLVTLVVTWCSSLCGSKRRPVPGSERARCTDLRAAAQTVAGALHSCSSTATSSPGEASSPFVVTGPGEQPAAN